jgi:hypothetical protein
VPTLPAELDELNPVLARMLAKKASDRFATMSEFTHALRDVFVHSTQLRAKAELAPNQPWTEQLRQMGFSFDTLRDGELNVRLRQQQADALAANRAADRNNAASSASAAATANKKPWLALALAAVVLIVVAGYFLSRPSGNGKTDRYALQGMAAIFDEQLQKGALFEPIDDNAAQTIADMRAVSSKSEITKTRLERLNQAVQSKLDALLAAGQLDVAQKLFDQAQDAELYDDSGADKVLARIVETRRALENKAEIDAQLAKLNSALERADQRVDLLAALDDLRKLLPKDAPQLLAVETKITAVMIGRLELALNNNDTDQAVRLLSEISAKLPNFPKLAQYQNDIRERQAKLGVSAQLAKIKVLLAKRPLQIDAITLAASGISALNSSNPNLPELAALKTQLLADANAAALEALNARNDIKTAQAVISALGEFKGDDAVRPARTRILAALEATQVAELTGFAVIDTAPFSKVISITDSNGQSFPVPAPAVTPLRLALLEGRYRVELSNGVGESKSVQISVTRKATSESPHLLYGAKADDYLREAGY